MLLSWARTGSCLASPLHGALREVNHTVLTFLMYKRQIFPISQSCCEKIYVNPLIKYQHMVIAQ